MPLNINEFKSAIHKYDLERPNLFEVNITIPDLLRKYTNGPLYINKTENGKLVSLFCKNANLPGLNLATTESIRYGIGPSIKMPVRGSLNDISLTFLNDSNSYVYGFFYTWIQSIYPQTQNSNKVPGADQTYQHPFKKDYQTDMTITVYHGKPGQFKGAGLLQTIASVASAAAGVPFLGSLIGGRSLPDVPLVPTKRYSVKKLYPTNISDIGLSTSATDSVSEFTVNFTYQTFDIQIAGQV
jgi:hypothetical protein